MSTATLEQQAAATASGQPNPTWRMPRVETGMIVLWYEGGVKNDDRPGRAAVVARVNAWSVALNIIEPESHTMATREGVRHVADPNAKADELAQDGSWDHTKFTKDVLQLLKR